MSRPIVWVISAMSRSLLSNWYCFHCFHPFIHNFHSHTSLSFFAFCSKDCHLIQLATFLGGFFAAPAEPPEHSSRPLLLPWKTACSPGQGAQWAQVCPKIRYDISIPIWQFQWERFWQCTNQLWVSYVQTKSILSWYIMVMKIIYKRNWVKYSPPNFGIGMCNSVGSEGAHVFEGCCQHLDIMDMCTHTPKNSEPHWMLAECCQTSLGPLQEAFARQTAKTKSDRRIEHVGCWWLLYVYDDFGNSLEFRSCLTPTLPAIKTPNFPDCHSCS